MLQVDALALHHGGQANPDAASTYTVIGRDTSISEVQRAQQSSSGTLAPQAPPGVPEYVRGKHRTAAPLRRRAVTPADASARLRPTASR